jgi:hypothetical protein
MADKPKDIPLAATVGARTDAVRHSLYAEGITSKYVEGVRSVYAEGLKARSAYTEGGRAPLDDTSAKVALKVAQAQVRHASQMARLHHRLDRISEYLEKKHK